MKCGVASTVSNPKFPRIETILNEELGKAMYGEQSAEEALDNAADQAGPIPAGGRRSADGPVTSWASADGPRTSPACPGTPDRDRRRPGYGEGAPPVKRAEPPRGHPRHDESAISPTDVA